MAEVAGDVLVGDSEESAGAAAGVIDRVAQFRLDRVDHRPDDLARGEELSTVGVLLTHLEQEVLIHLREREKMRVVHMINADLVHLVQNIAEVRLAVHAHALDSGHDPADHPLLPRGRGVRQLGRGINIQRVQVRQQPGVDELEELPVAFGKQFLPLPAVGLALVGLRKQRD